MPPTYAELQAERWWGREVLTTEFEWLHQQISDALDIPRGNVGSKGDNRHLNGSHRSQEWILNSRWCTNRTYTVQSGLTPEQARHLAGCDITPKTREQMLAICRNLDREVRAGRLEEVREWYGNTNDDLKVDGWNNIADRVATSDASHLWHLHMGVDRRALRDMTVMRRILAALLGKTLHREEDMAAIPQADWENLDWVTRSVRDGQSPIAGGPVAGAKLWLVDQIRAIRADTAVLMGRPALVVTDELVDELAEQIALVLAERQDNPITTAGHKAAVKAAVAELLREGIGTPS